MHHKISIVLFCLTTFLNLQAQNEDTDVRMGKLSGTWQIDLRPSPESEPYLQEFTIIEVGKGSFTGTFYGSGIRDAQTNLNWDKLYFAFTTSDNTYDYYHTGYIDDEVIKGTSYCPGRKFIQPWVGEKQ